MGPPPYTRRPVTALQDLSPTNCSLAQCPFFFGIYLLQSSFLLLLIAEKLKGEASPNVVKACETIVRAHEACIVTLNTEYQVSRFPATVNLDVDYPIPVREE
jgi:hypothetical protein